MGILIILLSAKGLPKYGNLKDFSLALVWSLNEDMQIGLYSSARIAASRCCKPFTF